LTVARSLPERRAASYLEDEATVAAAWNERGW